MHRSGKEEAVCSAVSRILQADAREGQELVLTERDGVDVIGGCRCGSEPFRRRDAKRGW